MYQSVFKRMIDFVCALAALVILSPLFLVLIVWVKADSKGPAFFRQRRIGRFEREFRILKFRTMRADTPPDIPTHQFSRSESYITKAGRFLRKTSLDELPQLLNILSGKMSFVGPRPALWNQYDLTSLRRERGVGALRPGLTGLAQVSGRDELPIPVKVEYDARYAAEIGFVTDLKILLKTVKSVLKSDGIVEGRQ